MRRRPVADRLAEKLVPDGSCTIRPIRTQSRLARPQNLSNQGWILRTWTTSTGARHE